MEPGGSVTDPQSVLKIDVAEERGVGAEPVPPDTAKRHPSTDPSLTPYPAGPVPANCQEPLMPCQ